MSEDARAFPVTNVLSEPKGLQISDLVLPGKLTRGNPIFRVVTDRAVPLDLDG